MSTHTEEYQVVYTTNSAQALQGNQVVIQSFLKVEGAATKADVAVSKLCASFRCVVSAGQATGCLASQVAALGGASSKTAADVAALAKRVADLQKALAEAAETGTKTSSSMGGMVTAMAGAGAAVASVSALAAAMKDVRDYAQETAKANLGSLLGTEKIVR